MGIFKPSEQNGHIRIRFVSPREFRHQLLAVQKLVEKVRALETRDTWMPLDGGYVNEVKDVQENCESQKRMCRNLGGAAATKTPDYFADSSKPNSPGSLQNIFSSNSVMIFPFIFISPRTSTADEKTSVEQITMVRRDQAVITGDMKACHTNLDNKTSWGAAWIIKWLGKITRWYLSPKAHVLHDKGLESPRHNTHEQQ